MHLDPRQGRRSRARGLSLLESMIAFLVLTLGLVGVSRMQGHLRLGADDARQRSEAVRFAQRELEAVRAGSALGAASAAPALDELAGSTTDVDAEPDTGAARYLLSRTVRDDVGGHAQATTVTVAWHDRAGNAQQVVLDAIVARSNPALGAALGLRAATALAAQPFGRSVFVPATARDLGNGSSAFKPVAGGTLAWILDNATGRVTAACDQVDAATTNGDLRLAALSGCSPRSGHLVSGQVRFTRRAGPDGRADEVPLALQVVVHVTGQPAAAAPACFNEALKTVTTSGADGRVRTVSVGLHAVPASLGVERWAESGERHVAYHCLVAAADSGAWSGRSAIVPLGWTIGTGAGDHRVCRFETDLDGSGRIDDNREHPAQYTSVAGPLLQQNFLVVPGTASCPGSAGDGARGVAMTRQHQP